MLTRRSSSPFDLFDRLEQQLRQRQTEQSGDPLLSEFRCGT
jgi:hypothetical protein